MAVINTNIGAIKAANASNSASKMLGTAMERLSTGKRINSAKDDAAGLAIATSMTSQVRGMNQAIRNANDGISLAQTAKARSTKSPTCCSASANWPFSRPRAPTRPTDRTNMQTEVAAAAAQIDQVLTNTKFNGVHAVRHGHRPTPFTIQAGANSSDTVDLTSSVIDRHQLRGDRRSTFRRPRWPTTTIGNVDPALDSTSTPPAPRSAPGRTAWNRWSTT